MAFGKSAGGMDKRGNKQLRGSAPGGKETPSGKKNARKKAEALATKDPRLQRLRDITDAFARDTLRRQGQSRALTLDERETLFARMASDLSPDEQLSFGERLLSGGDIPKDIAQKLGRIADEHVNAGFQTPEPAIAVQGMHAQPESNRMPSPVPSAGEGWTPAERQRQFLNVLGPAKQAETVEIAGVDRTQLISEVESLRTQRGLYEETIKAERMLLEARHRELEELRARGRAVSVEMQELKAIPEHLKLLGDQQLFMDEVTEIQNSITPEERESFARRYLEQVTTALGNKELKSKREAYAVFTTALRAARKESKQESETHRDIPAPTIRLDTKAKPKLDYAIDLSQRAAAALAKSGSAVLDAGTASSLIMFGLLASYGSKAATLLQTFSPAHLALFGGCFVALAPLLEKVEGEAWMKSALEDKRFLNERAQREWNRPKEKAKRIGRRTIAGLTSVMVTAVQLHTIFWAVAATKQGGDTSRKLAEGIQDLRDQTANLEVADFNNDLLSSFDTIEDLAQDPSFLELSVVERALVQLRLKRQLVVRAEVSGREVPGAGQGRGVGYHQRAAAKDVLGSGTTEQAPAGEDLSSAAEHGIALGNAARERIRARFAERFPDHPGVLIDVPGNPVTLEEQLMVFNADYQTAVQSPMRDLEARYGNINTLGRRIQELSGTHVAEEGEEEVANPIRDFFAQAFAGAGTKGRFSIGVKDPSESTIAPDFRALSSADSPLFQVQHTYNDQFLSPAQYFLQLVEAEYNAIDGVGGVEIDVPQAALNPEPLTSVPLRGEPNIASVEFYGDVFANGARATGAGLLVLLFLFLRHGGSSINYLRFRARRDGLLDDFNLKRAELEGEGDIREGAEYRFAKRTAAMLEHLLKHELVQGAFGDVKMTPELVLSAMREAAAEQPERIGKKSPTRTKEPGFMGAIAALAEGYVEAMAEIPSTGTPLPESVKAYNHLVRLYRNPAELSVRVADKLLPGFSKVMELALTSKERKGLREFPEYQDLPPDVAERYVDIELAMNATKIRHLEFRKRHEQTRVDFMRDDAFAHIYYELTGTDLKALKFFDQEVDLRHADFGALKAQYGDSIDTYRHSGLSRVIASAMQGTLDDAREEISKADEQIAQIRMRETRIIAKYGGTVAQRMKEGIAKRDSEASEHATFVAPDSAHAAQFSSREAIERTYIEEMVRRSEEQWRGQFTKNDEETDIVPQLEAFQKAVGTSAFGTFAVPEGYAEPQVRIVPRVRLSAKERAKNRTEAGSVSDKETEQFTDYHVMTLTFFDNEQKSIYEYSTEIRSLLSENREPADIEATVARHLESRQSFFSLRVNLWDIQKQLERHTNANEREVLASQLKLRTLGFMPTSFARTKTDFQPIDLSKPNALEGVRLLMQDLRPRLDRRRRLAEMANGNKTAQEVFLKDIEPIVIAPPPKSDTNRAEKITKTKRSIVSRHKAARERIGRITEEMKPETIESRFDTSGFARIQRLIERVNAPEERRAIRRAGIRLEFTPAQSGTIVLSTSQGIFSKQLQQSISVGDLLDILERSDGNIARDLKRVALRGAA